MLDPRHVQTTTASGAATDQHGNCRPVPLGAVVDHLDYSPLPERLREGVRRWVEDHVAPGDFLCAVIRNDLSGAIYRADDDNLPRLPEIVRWFYNEAPGLCWGSVEAFNRWRAAGRQVSA